MKLFKKGQKGFTLVELMVVMAIIAVLAAIVIPPVSGTKQTGSDTQNKQDGSAIQTAVGKYNADANLAENLSTVTATVVGESASQVISNKWPEQAISAAYVTVFTSATTAISAVTIKDKSGNTSYATGNSTASMDDFVAKYNAVDFTKLESGGYIQSVPNGVSATFSTSKPYHNYLWLVKKVAVDGVADVGRVVEVYSLTTVATTSSIDALTYQRIY